MAIIAIGGGFLAVMALTGFQILDLFQPSVTEEATVTLRVGTDCIVEGSDAIPRTISNCEYSEGDTILITYQPQRPTLERHERL